MDLTNKEMSEKLAEFKGDEIKGTCWVPNCLNILDDQEREQLWFFCRKCVKHRPEEVTKRAQLLTKTYEAIKTLKAMTDMRFEDLEYKKRMYELEHLRNTAQIQNAQAAAVPSAPPAIPHQHIENIIRNMKQDEWRR